jgi:hypothetical protein
MPTLRPRLERLEAARERQHKAALDRLLGLLTPAEKRALAEGLTADLDGTWAVLDAGKQALTCAAFEKMAAAATPAEWAMISGGMAVCD